MMRTERALLCAAMMISCSWAAGAAGAPPKPRGAASEGAFDQAGALFDKGSAFFKQGRWVEAEAAFQQAWDLRQSYDVATNLGDCELEIGQSREAAEHLTYALKHFPVVAKAERRERLVQRLKEARERVGTLVVRVNLAGAEIWADGRKVGLSPLSEEVFVDPGKAHTVEAKLAGYEGKAQTVELEKGERILVTVELGKKEGGAGAAGPVAGAPAESGSGSGSERQAPSLPPSSARPIWPVAIGAGTALVLLGGGIGFTVAANSKMTDALALGREVGGRSVCYGQPAGTVAATCSTLRSAVADNGTFSNAAMVSFIAGSMLALSTVGVGVWTLGAKPTAEVQIAPAIGVRQGGIVMGGIW